MSERTVRRALNDLIDEGMIIKESRYRENGGQSSNLYTLIDSNESANIESIDFFSMKSIETGVSDHQNKRSEVKGESVNFKFRQSFFDNKEDSCQGEGDRDIPP
jgi:predicted transcriptional regulator